MDQIRLDPQDKLPPTPQPSDTLSIKHPPPTGQKSACGPPTPEDNFWNSPYLGSFDRWAFSILDTLALALTLSTDTLHLWYIQT